MATAPYPLAGPAWPDAAFGEADQLSFFVTPKNVSKAATIMWTARRTASHNRFVSPTHARPLFLALTRESCDNRDSENPLTARHSRGHDTEAVRRLRCSPIVS
jgi:hypothetical protein